MQSDKITALHSRLSHDDGYEGESNSISPCWKNTQDAITSQAFSILWTTDGVVPAGTDRALPR